MTTSANAERGLPPGQRESAHRVRVLWLVKGLGRGGAERLLVGAAPLVDRDRFDIEVAYLLPWKDALVGELEAHGVTVHCLDSRHSTDLRWTRRLRRLVRAKGYDIVHTHMPIPAVGARLALPKHGPAIIHTEHNVWRRYRWATRRANALTYRRNEAVLAVSRAVADSIHRPRRRPATWPRVEVVYQGANLAAIQRGDAARASARARLGLGDSLVVIGTVGNFTVKKDQRTLLEAFTRLAASNSQLHLVLVGSGPLEATLREAAQQLGIERLVTFTGSRDDVLELLPGFDIFALTSRHEGLPIALLEAMASGLPCVATSVGGIPEVITHGAQGLLVPPLDASAVEAAIAKLVEDPSLRAAMGAAGAERAAAFDIGGAVRRTEALYGEVLADR